MTLPQPTNFAAYAPDYSDYFKQGAQAVLAPVQAYDEGVQVVEQQRQRQAQLEAMQERNRLAALLEPGQVTAQDQANQIRALNLRRAQPPIFDPTSPFGTAPSVRRLSGFPMTRCQPIRPPRTPHH